MDDPIQTYKFIKDIIDAKSHEIVGLAVPKGNRLTLSKEKSKYIYLISLLLIMGPLQFLKSAFTTISFKLRKKLFKYKVAKDPSIKAYAESKGIPTMDIITPNSKKFRTYLETLDLDIIINQSQNIIKKELINIPRIGILNRHNALLPKNRGRLTPFWVIYNGDEETGVSIHFVEEGIDSGDIIVQKKFRVTKEDNFNSIVKKNYAIASDAMIEAIEKLKEENCILSPNDDKSATYNTTPTLKNAVSYRIKRIKQFFK